MGSVTTVGVFLDRFRALLAADGSLSGVRVFTAVVDPEEAGKESIILGWNETDASETYETVPQQEIWESYPIGGSILIVYPGAGEDAIKKARDRALAIFAEVLIVLKAHNEDTPTTQADLGVDDARVTAWKLVQGIVPDGGRAAEVTFTVTVRAVFEPA